MYGWRAKLGLIVPSPNTVAEIEIRRLLPKGVEAYVSRCPYPGTQDIEKKKTFYEERIEPLIWEAAGRLSGLKPDLIVWACTLGSLLQGPQSDRRISQDISDRTGYPALTTTTAVIEFLQHFNLKKIVVATPYPKLFSEAVNRYLQDHVPGLEILSAYSGEIVEGYSKAIVSAFDLYSTIKAQVVKNPSLDGVFISCTNWPTLEIIDHLKADTGAKIFSSVTATVWCALQHLRIACP